MDTYSVDGGAKVGKCVEHTLLAAPVKGGLPVAHQLFHIGQVRSIVPSRIGNLIGPMCLCQALAEVIECLLWNGNRKGLYGHRKMLLSSAEIMCLCNLTNAKCSCI